MGGDMLKDNGGFINRFEPVSVCHFGIFHFADLTTASKILLLLRRAHTAHNFT